MYINFIFHLYYVGTPDTSIFTIFTTTTMLEKISTSPAFTSINYKLTTSIITNTDTFSAAIHPTANDATRIVSGSFLQ